jgi:3-methyladenine DNA glycosylase/8-oxoguanine DNA glycosylase
MEVVFDPGRPLSIPLTLGPLCRGRGDPTVRIGRDLAWRATRTPEGPATLRVGWASPTRISARAWGPGRAWALATLPSLLGDDDDDAGFVPHHPVIAHLRHHHPGLRIGRSQAVMESLVPTIIEQKVTGREAWRSYAALVRSLGEPAPGPAGDGGLLLPPPPAALASAPSWAYHRWGVERRRAETIRRAALASVRMEETVSMSLPDARARLSCLPGMGPWTAAEVAMVALGDADAVSVGDYHLPNQVAWALAGEPRGDDARMLELLEPYRGHRGRVLRLLGAGHVVAPRFGPRSPIRSIRSL